ncbi:hypothetical protein D3C76_1448880 [compost metagenome]
MQATWRHLIPRLLEDQGQSQYLSAYTTIAGCESPVKQAALIVPARHTDHSR